MASRVVASGLFLCGLVAFACSSPDVRPPVDTSSPGNTQGAGTGGGNSSQPTSSDDGGGDVSEDSGPGLTEGGPCTNVNCLGCCDGNNVCQPGTASGACGSSGQTCTTCVGAQTCVLSGNTYSCG